MIGVASCTVCGGWRKFGQACDCSAEAHATMAEPTVRRIPVEVVEVGTVSTRLDDGWGSVGAVTLPLGPAVLEVRR